MSIKVFNTNFYPRSPCGERQPKKLFLAFIWLFLSTLSLRRATSELATSKIIKKFLSTLSLRRATFITSMLHDPGKLFLSTLSLRRATIIQMSIKVFNTNFYPRSPCGERPASAFLIGSRSQFLSTLSLRRATSIINIINNIIDDFYPRSPCGERRALRQLQSALCHFYPRSPCGERLIDTSKDTIKTVNFYPRSPCGERPGRVYSMLTLIQFLSTLSLRRATSRNGLAIR